MPSATARTSGNGRLTSPDLLEQLAPAPGRRRRNWPRVGAASALALLCGALFVLLYASAGSRHPFLAVARAVAPGQVITSADLTTARVPSDPALSPIPADEASLVIGRHAAVALVPGTLLTSSDVASGPLVASGDASVGLDLKPGQLPAGLEPGDSVLVIQTAGPQSSALSGFGQPTVLGKATVLALRSPPADSPTGDTVVTLVVSTSQVAQVVDEASAGQISLAGLGSTVGSS